MSLELNDFINFFDNGRYADVEIISKKRLGSWHLHRLIIGLQSKYLDALDLQCGDIFEIPDEIDYPDELDLVFKYMYTLTDIDGEDFKDNFIIFLKISLYLNYTTLTNELLNNLSIYLNDENINNYMDLVGMGADYHDIYESIKLDIIDWQSLTENNLNKLFNYFISKIIKHGQTHYFLENFKKLLVKIGYTTDQIDSFLHFKLNLPQI